MFPNKFPNTFGSPPLLRFLLFDNLFRKGYAPWMTIEPPSVSSALSETAPLLHGARRPRKPDMPGAEDFVAFLRRSGCKTGSAIAYLRIANRIHDSGLSGAEWLEQEARVPDPRAGERGTAKKTVGVFRAAVAYYEVWKHPTKKLKRREVSVTLLSANAFRRGEEREAAAEEDVVTLMGEAAAEEPLFTILHVLAETGARIAEVCGMQLKDIDWDRKEIRFYGKRGKTRTTPVTLQVLSCLKNYIETVRAPAAPPGEHLFYGKRWETPIWTTGLNRDLREYKKPDGSGYFTPHQLRHLAATEMVQAGESLPVVRDLLGHESIGTLNTYLKSDKAEQRRAIEKRAKKFFGT